MHEMFGKPNRSWIFNYFNQRPEEEKEQFRQLFYENMLDAHSPQEVAQKALGANSPEEVAQKALGANSPEEAALKLVQTEEERRDLIARLQQMSF